MSEKNYLVLARKKRPQKFADVVGQEHITNTLKNALKSGRIAHAFLFSGTRGVGKTTCARILAKALNCEKGPLEEPCNTCASCNAIASGTDLDVIEIDGASTGRVDEVRELREKAGFSPTSSRFKVYIIDEVHMLSNSAFNALLKTLEEPPPHVKFILATTEPHKLPATVLSRCQRYDFRTLPDEIVIDFLSRIAAEEKLDIDEEAVKLLARVAAGSVRDALSVFESIISFSDKGTITSDSVQEILGIVDAEFTGKVVEAIIDNDAQNIIKLSSELVSRGYDVNFFCESFLQYLRDLMLITAEGTGKKFDMPGYERKAQLSMKKSFDEWLMLFNLFFDCCRNIKRADNPSLILEVSLLKCMRARFVVPLDDIIGKLSKLSGKARGEDSISSGRVSGREENFNNDSLTSDKGPPERTERKTKRNNEISESGREYSQAENIVSESSGDALHKDDPACRWEDFLKLLEEKSIILKSIFANGCRKSLNDNVLTFSLSDEFTISMVKMGDNLRILKETVKEYFGKHVDIKVELEKDAGNDISKKEMTTSTEREAFLKRALKDEVVSEILELLPARITDVSLTNK